MSFPPGQRWGPAATGDDEVPYLVDTFFHIYTTPTTLEYLWTTPDSTPPHILISDRPGIIETARGEIFSPEQHQSPAVSGNDKVPSPGHKHPTHLHLQQPGNENGHTAPQGVENPPPVH